MGIAFRRHGMRYRDKDGGGAGLSTADHRVSMLSDLLGITTWNPGRAGSPGPAHPPAAGHRASEPPAGVEQGDQDDQDAEDGLPPGEQDRPPPPQEADLNTVLWGTAPTELAPTELAPIELASTGPAPEVARMARISIRAPGRTALITLPTETQALGLAAGQPDPDTLAPAPEPPPAPWYPRRTAGQATSSARERLHLERALRARRRRRFRITSVAAMALIAAAVATGFALHHGGGSTSTGTRPRQASATPGPTHR